MRRRALLPLLCLALVLPAVAAGASKQSWAQREIRLVTSRGLMGTSPATFKPDAPLTQQALSDLVARLTDKETSATADPSAPVTMAKLDAKLVSALGLGADAATFAGAARDAGLAPPSRFGTEVVARLLGLRTNHPTGQDALELLPNDPATRAEAAYSAAQILGFGAWSLQSVADDAAEFELPQLTPWQQRILRVAVSFIGYPYVWGGTSEHPQTPLGLSTPGGFDCSGFVWRVYKLQSYAGAPQLGGVLRGRTTMQMSGEVPKSQRIKLADLQPADVMFFGDRGPKSTPAQVNHAAIYLGNGWLIQSSGNGVALARVDGWYSHGFAWGRRPLSEAHLSQRPKSPDLVMSGMPTDGKIVESHLIPRPMRKGKSMLQWKPRFFAVLTLAALALAAFGGYAGSGAGDTFRQFGW